MRQAIRILSLAVAVVFFTIASAWALNTQLHRPTTGATGGYEVHSADTLPQGQVAVGFDANYADDFFESTVFNPLSRNNIDVGDQLASFDFLATAGLADWMNLSIDVPVHFFHDINIGGAFNNNNDNQWASEVGDLLVNIKMRVINPNDDHGFGMAIIPFIAAPTGKPSLFQGDRNASGGGHVALEKRLANGGTRLYANVGVQFRDTEQLSFIDNLKHEMLYGAGLQQALSEENALHFITEVSGSTNFKSEIASPAEFTASLRKAWGENKNYLTHVGTGIGLGDGYGSPDWRTFAGVAYVFGPKAEAKPIAAADTDGDGLLDDDEVTKYKTDPRNKDTDGDTCKDGEEVLKFSTDPLKKDCPPLKIDLKGRINFKSGSAEISPESFTVLDYAVARMQAHPEIEVVEIEGHTDAQGKDDYNMDLSQRRADSVKAYFVKNGIDGNRLTTKGYGETKPVGSNDTAEGRADNRRIVFSVVKYKK